MKLSNEFVNKVIYFDNIFTQCYSFTVNNNWWGWGFKTPFKPLGGESE